MTRPVTRGKVRRAFKVTALALACLLLVVVGTAAWLLGTESGLRFALARAAGYLPEGIEIGAVQGTASGPLVVRDVRVQTTGFSLELDRVELEWGLMALFGRQIRVDRLHADGLRYAAHERPPPPEEQGEPFELPEEIELPVDIFIEDARIRDVSLQMAAEGEPVVVDAVRLEAQWTERLLDIENLEIDAPLADVRANAEVTPRGDYPLHADLRYMVRPPDLAPMTGSTRLDGSLKHLELLQSWAEPYNLRLEATLQNVLRDLRFEATAEVTEIRLARIGEGLPPAVLRTRIDATGGLEGVRVDLTASATEPELGHVDAVFAGELTRESITIERLIVEPANGRLTADGRVELTGPQPVVDVEAQWESLQWPLKGASQVASERGSLDVTGTLQDYRARLEAELGVPNQADGRVVLAGTGDDGSFTFSAIDIATLEGTLRGTADVAWAPELAGRIDLEGRGLNPGGLAGAWPGSIDLTIRGAGRMAESGPTARVETLRAQGRLRGQPLELDARGVYADDQLELETFALRSGRSDVRADGRIGDELAVDWSITSEDLGTLLPSAGGSLQGHGNVSGPLTAPRVTAEVSGSDLSYEAHELASLELQADVDASSASRSDLTLELQDGTLGGIDVETLSLTGSGTKREHALGLAAETSAGRLDFGVDGTLDADNAWAFVIQQLDYARPGLTPWSLRSPAQGRVAAGAAALERLCLAGGPALLCVEGERTSERLEAAFELEDLPFALADPLLPAAVRLEGSIGGTGSLLLAQGRDAAAGGPVAHVDLETTPIRLLAEGAAGEMTPVLAFAAGEIALDVSGSEAAKLELDLPLEGGGGLGARATVAAGAGTLIERPLEGRVSARLPDIAFLAEFVPPVAELAGRLDGDLGVSGTLSAPALDGSVELSDGMAMLTGPEIRLRDVHAAVRGQGAGNLGLEARASSGEGTLSIEGNAGTNDAGPHATLAVHGENFRVFNTPEATVAVTPDLDVKLAGKRLEVTGVVRVPAARIELTEAPASAVAVSDDQVIVQAETKEAPADEAFQVAAEVQVILGEPGQAREKDPASDVVDPGDLDVSDDPVSFVGFGLTAALAGDLTVTEQPGEPTTATGAVNVTEGSYTAYGQDLEITRGRVLFAGGPVDEPGIDVRAVRQPAEDILVGVEARGSLMQPEFSVFSEPAMSQSEQLSWLVLGRALEGGAASESSALARAALALGIKGGNVLTERLGRRLGVDQIGIETEPGQSSEQAALVLGKYLSPDLYVSYGIGLLEPVSTLKLSYALSSKWRLVTESSSVQSGGDLIYSIER